MDTRVVLAEAQLSQDNPTIQGMQTKLSQYQVKDNVPMFGLHGTVSRPLPGAHMAVLYQDGDPSKAVCLAVNDPRYFISGLPDGTVGTAHHGGASILFYADRIEIQGAALPIKLLNCADVDIETSTRVRVKGDLQVTGEVTGRCDGEAVHLTIHSHSDPQGGAVGPPNG